MSLPKVTVVLQNGQLGQSAQTNDGIAGMIIIGGTPPGAAPTFSYDTPFMLESLADCATYGIVKDDADTGVIYKQIKDFYDEAGDGSTLYVTVLPETTTLADAVDVANTHVDKLRDYAQGKMRLLTVARIPAGNYVAVLTAGIDADVYAAITKADALAVAYFTQYKPLRIILPGLLFNDTIANLTDLTTLGKNHVAVTLLCNDNSTLPAVGLVLGRLAKVPVQRKISRVKDGAINMADAYIGSKKIATDLSDANLDSIDDKGFIIGRAFVNKAGFYFNGDHTATADTDDYDSLARGRVIDKAAVIAYTTYVDELDDEVAINADGQMAPEIVMGLQKNIETQIANQMADEISSVTAYIDPAQNILSTNKLMVTLKITPVGYSQQIDVLLGFANPNP